MSEAMSGEDAEFSRFGPYLIVRTSGAGGMGRVDLALRTDGGPPEICILKRRHGNGATPAEEARFERESRIAARLAHPNIARVLRVETVDGELCMAQEFIEGVTLGRLMAQAKSQSIPFWAAAHVTREVASALAHAHDFGGQGIVHRDVTPENVMLGFNGDVKLIDFGISRSQVDGTVTSTGMVVGRRAYISPEAWAGAKPDRRTDIFSLGVVLWELLMGRRVEELDGAPVKEALPDPRTLRPEIPGDLAAVAMRALAPDPELRFASATELRNALGQAVPTGKDPKTALAALLAFFFNVDRAREILRGQIDDARRSLRRSGDAVSKKARPNRGVWIAAAGLAVLLGSGIGISALLRESPQEILRAAHESFDKGDLAAALDDARRAVAAGAGAPGHVLVGSIYMNRGQLDAAERELEMALRLNPGDAEATRRLSDVRAVRREHGQ